MKTNELITELRTVAKAVAPPARELLIAAAEELERLGAELVDERYRHDRYVDFELAQSQELAQLREERRWIPVEERLPMNDTYILVTTDGVVVPAYWHNDRFYAFTANGVATVGGVTHWIPLPEPPKKGGNEK